MYKVGTVAELEALDFEGKIPKEVFKEVLRVVTYLDDTFGAERDVDSDDGGFVVIITENQTENQEDLDWFAQNCVELESPALEYVLTVQSERGPYINAFYLVNEYEFGITLFVPMSIAPEVLLKEVYASVVHR